MRGSFGGGWTFVRVTLLALTVAFGLLAGACGDSDNQSAADVAGARADAAETADSGGGGGVPDAAGDAVGDADDAGRDGEVDGGGDADGAALGGYAGQCGGNYAEVKLGDRLSSRTEVTERLLEVFARDCRGNSGCGVGTSQECGDGDRWACLYCFDEICIEAGFVSECLPPLDATP